MARLTQTLKWFLVGSTALIILPYLVLAGGLAALVHWVTRPALAEPGLRQRLVADPEVLPLLRGIDSFARRLALIQTAQASIELDFFIYDVVQATPVITQALLMKRTAQGDQGSYSRRPLGTGLLVHSGQRRTFTDPWDRRDNFSANWFAWD